MHHDVPSELLALAKRVVWHLPPEEVVGNADLLLSYLMTYGTLVDVIVARRYFTNEDFRHALVHAPAGVFDPRSWNYWNLVYNDGRVPPLPHRSIA